MTQELTTRKCLPFPELSVPEYFTVITSMQNSKNVEEKTLEINIKYFYYHSRSSTLLQLL